ncbi:MAG TPA: cupin domain-containing protein [Pyrinomonadaceae bacterium]|nr:cupin domain-containing protein [Pyrinomonadaceae bacterium]
MDVVNLNDKFKLFDEHWKPKIAGEVNDAYVKLVKFKGEFLWHKHDAEDELFLVVKGNMTIKLRDRDLQLAEGEFAIIPRGVEHMPVADEEVHVMLIEPKTTLNTGDRQTARTLPELERI